MLNQRQIEILLELHNNTNVYLKASELAQKQQVSLRTVQADIKLIKQELMAEKCAVIYSEPAKGSRLQIDDSDKFSSYLNALYKQYAHAALNYPSSRWTQILLYLLNQHRAVSMHILEDMMHISKSTLLNDLKKVSELIERFNLELLKGNNRILIDGSENNKRLCLADHNMYLMHVLNEKGVEYVDQKQISYIQDILTDMFVEFKYYIADTDFKNTILNLNITIKRMQEGFYIAPDDLEITDDLEYEKEMSLRIFEKIKSTFHVKITEEEIDYFALYLKGQGNYQNTSIISNEIDDFILDSLTKIRNDFGMDFIDNINLRITLALHCTPLSIRIKHNMQVKNGVYEYIRKSFPLGYNIAAYFALLLQEKFGKKISDDEIALIAVHFYNSLLEFNNKSGTKRVLVISSMKNSMTTLLRQKLLKWFSENISELEIAHGTDVTEDMLDNYDIFLTTEKGEFFEKGLALFINVFPNNYDYLNIKLVMDGFSDIEDVIQIFQKDLFYTIKKKNKEDILSELCTMATEKFKLESLYDEVLKREEMGSTFFTRDIAVPHPVHAVSSDTFVVVGVSEQPVRWDEDNNTVNLVILVCIGKNNPKAFQLWDYISKMFGDSSFVERVTKNPEYGHFIANLKQSLEIGIKNNETN